MKKFEDMTLQGLYLELGVIDDLLTTKKQKRAELLQDMEQELINENHINAQAVLEEYKEQLNDDLGIEDLRADRVQIKNVIEEKQKQNDAQVADNYR